MRLIDADYLKEHLMTCAINGMPLHRMYTELDELLIAIDDVPTIKPESNWIPCSERLPELWDYVLCSQINGDVGEGKLLDDECWHICYDQSHRKKSWVVAWQPLPEKFKEEGEEE